MFNFLKKNLPTSNIDYNCLFESKEYRGVTLSTLALGMLKVPTGAIVASDPLTSIDFSESFLKHIPKGEYPVSILVADTITMGERYSLAKLTITHNTAIKWELAITKQEEKKIHEFKNGEFIGFPVDAGLGSFCDALTQQQYNQFIQNFYKQNPTLNIYDDFFAKEFKKNAKDQNDPRDIGDWINFTVPNTHNNVIMFHSGYGDGLYPSYWGIDSKGQICSLVIDFLIFER